MANVIPMSGSGSRFADVGYLLPKPLIPVSGRPMILAVIDSLPPAEKWIFIVRREHVEKYAVDVIILSRLPNAVIVIEDNPVGQATSCALALPHLEKDEDVFIAACDNAFVYNKEKYEALRKNPAIDAIVWTFTKDELLTDNPKAWGWIKLEGDNQTIADMSVKAPVSDNPFDDHAVVATFYFRRAADFQAAFDLMVKENYRINNEFYVDSMPIFLKKLGKKSVIFDVDLYVGWGKPGDLYKYEEKEYLCRHLNGQKNGQPIDNLELWQSFFKSLDK